MEILLGITSLVSLVCWIIVLIRLFQSEGVGLGILGIICGLYTLIWGWINASSEGITTVMIIWTASIAASVVFQNM